MPRKNSKHLTDPGIAKISKAPPGRRIERFDAGAPGLCLRVTEKGVKSWSVYYRLNGKHKRKTIGAWPAVGVAEAREKAREIKAQSKEGIDPNAKRRHQDHKGPKTFGDIVEDYFKRATSGLRRGWEIERIVKRELMPEWGSRPASEIMPEDVIEVTERLLDAEKPAAADKLFEVVRRIFNWAIKRRIYGLDLSPCDRMESPAQRAIRHRVLNDPEIKAVWSACDSMGYPFGPFYKLCLLSGQRLDEIAGMQHSEIDPDKEIWVIPTERCKSKRPHVVPLPQTVLHIIQSLPHFDGPYVFTTTSGQRPISGFSKAKSRLDKLCAKEKERLGLEHGFEDRWTTHDLRRTVRTRLAELGVAEIVAERVINHAPRGLGKIYNQYEYLPEKRDALARWTQALESLVTPPPENVIPLAARSQAS
jgi:integrase